MIYQSHPFSCFPVAVSNACIWKQIPPPPMDQLIEVAGCRHGGTICFQKVLDASGLNWSKDTSESVLQTQGIVIIMHPIYNLHAVFVYQKEETFIVNSQLGSLIAKKSELYSSINLPTFPQQQQAWRLE